MPEFMDMGFTQPEKIYDLALKGLLAMAVTFGWALLLYPFFRKLRKSWYVMMLVVAGLTVIFFLGKEVLDDLDTMYDEITAYSLGAFFGFSIISFLFWRKTREMDSEPEKQMFTKYGLQEPLSLRLLYQVAIAMEVEGKAFFEQLAEKLTDPDAKQVCLHIANEEENHRQVLHQNLMRWLPVPADRATIKRWVDLLKEKAGFYRSPQGDLTALQLLDFAIGLEMQFSEFYQSFEKSYPRHWKKMKIQFLIHEEQRHIEDFQKLRARFADPPRNQAATMTSPGNPPYRGDPKSLRP